MRNRIHDYRIILSFPCGLVMSYRGLHRLQNWGFVSIWVTTVAAVWLSLKNVWRLTSRKISHNIIAATLTRMSLLTSQASNLVEKM